jgi:hypothetical protein
MTEHDWLACADPYPMVGWASGKVSARKLRLFACACVRRVWHLLPDHGSRRVVETVEAFVDGRARKKDMAAARAAAPARSTDRISDWYAKAAVCCAAPQADACAVDTSRAILFAQRNQKDAAAERRHQAELVREIIGNPFRRVRITDGWPVEVCQLADSLYTGQDCAFALHDALLESGFTAVAEHFRDPQRPHPRGCWLVDLILNKK